MVRQKGFHIENYTVTEVLLGLFKAKVLIYCVFFHNVSYGVARPGYLTWCFEIWKTRPHRGHHCVQLQISLGLCCHDSSLVLIQA